MIVDAKEFLAEIFRGAPPENCITVCVPADESGGKKWRSAHVPVGAIGDAATQALEFDALGVDTYFGVATTCAGLSPLVRGSGDRGELLGAGCVWADVDVGQIGHAGKRCPPDADAVAQLIGDMPCLPSIAVDTGGGFHLYWLLAEWCDLERVTALCRAWQRLLRAKAEARGWAIDFTADAARVLRVPGTRNHKQPSAPRSVALDRESSFQRYAIDDLERMVTAAGQPIVAGKFVSHAAMLVEMAGLPLGELWQKGPFDLALLKEKLIAVRRSKSKKSSAEETLKAKRLGRVLDSESLADEDGARHESRRSITAVIAYALCTDDGAVPWPPVFQLMRKSLEATPYNEGEQDPVEKTKDLYERAALAASIERQQRIALAKGVKESVAREARMMKVGR